MSSHSSLSEQYVQACPTALLMVTSFDLALFESRKKPLHMLHSKRAADAACAPNDTIFTNRILVDWGKGRLSQFDLEQKVKDLYRSLFPSSGRKDPIGHRFNLHARGGRVTKSFSVSILVGRRRAKGGSPSVAFPTLVSKKVKTGGRSYGKDGEEAVAIVSRRDQRLIPNLHQTRNSLHWKYPVFHCRDM